MNVSLGRRAGRSHRERHVACQDAYAVVALPDGRLVAAVGDGLGSCPLSEHGSQAAVDAATASLAATRRWGPRALHRAFQSARAALERRAEELGAPAADLSTTLHVAAVSQDRVYAASVGDGAIVAAEEQPRLLLAPEESEYANLVTPITAPDWQDHLRTATAPRPQAILLFTDGLTRLLLQRRQGAWSPYGPFFQAFLPQLRASPWPTHIAARLLDQPETDAAWDDDKCLVVIAP